MMMTNRDVIDRLNDLIQLDVDATEAYRQALKRIDESEVFQTISQFRGDHLRHITELSAMVHSLGGIPKVILLKALRHFAASRALKAPCAPWQAMKRSPPGPMKTRCMKTFHPKF